MDNSHSCKQKIITKTSCKDNLRELLDYLSKDLPEGFWGNVVVKFKDGVPYLVEEQRQIKLDNSK